MPKTKFKIKDKLKKGSKIVTKPLSAVSVPLGIGMAAPKAIKQAITGTPKGIIKTAASIPKVGISKIKLMLAKRKFTKTVGYNHNKITSKLNKFNKKQAKLTENKQKIINKLQSTGRSVSQSDSQKYNFNYKMKMKKIADNKDAYIKKQLEKKRFSKNNKKGFTLSNKFDLTKNSKILSGNNLKSKLQSRFNNIVIKHNNLKTQKYKNKLGITNLNTKIKRVKHNLNTSSDGSLFKVSSSIKLDKLEKRKQLKEAKLADKIGSKSLEAKRLKLLEKRTQYQNNIKSLKKSALQVVQPIKTLGMGGLAGYKVSNALTRKLSGNRGIKSASNTYKNSKRLMSLAAGLDKKPVKKEEKLDTHVKSTKLKDLKIRLTSILANPDKLKKISGSLNNRRVNYVQRLNELEQAPTKTGDMYKAIRLLKKQIHKINILKSKLNQKK